MGYFDYVNSVVNPAVDMVAGPKGKVVNAAKDAASNAANGGAKNIKGVDSGINKKEMDYTGSVFTKKREWTPVVGPDYEKEDGVDKKPKGNTDSFERSGEESASPNSPNGKNKEKDPEPQMPKNLRKLGDTYFLDGAKYGMSKESAIQAYKDGQFELEMKINALKNKANLTEAEQKELAYLESELAASRAEQKWIENDGVANKPQGNTDNSQKSGKESVSAPGQNDKGELPPDIQNKLKSLLDLLTQFFSK